MHTVRATALISWIISSIPVLTSTAHAATNEPISLTWSAPPGSDCPDAAYVLSELRRYVGEAPVEKRASIRATATVSAVGVRRRRLVLTTTDEGFEGERVFEDESCRAVTDAAVVVLAWMIDPDTMAKRSPSTPAQPAFRAPRPSAEPLRLPQQSRAATPTPFFGLGMTGDSGTMPAAALGVLAHGGVSLPVLRLVAQVAYWPRASRAIATLADGQAAGARFSLGALGLGACVQAFPMRPAARIGFALCAAPEVDVIRGTGFGVNAPTQATKAWFSFSATLEGRVRVVNDVGLFVNLTGVLPTEREHFALGGVGEVYQPAAVAGRCSVGLEL
jgi:hypothetical protein